MSAPLAHLLAHWPEFREQAGEHLSDTALKLYARLNGPEVCAPSSARHHRALWAIGQTPDPVLLRLLVLHHAEPAHLALVTTPTDALTEWGADSITKKQGRRLSEQALLLLQGLHMIGATEQALHTLPLVYQPDPPPVYSDAPLPNL
jgi:hypothetical protein